MNFLAHIYLSGSNPETICGNFIGDGVKGKQVANFSPEIQKGIALHRFIDHYTDNHPVTAKARLVIRPEFRKYAGVVLDVYFDHFLGIHWPDYHSENLEEYVEKVHKTLDHFEPKMPEKMQRFYHYMKMYNWLLNYRRFDDLSLVFQGMASRTPFDSNMEKAVPVLQDNYREIEAAFELFFPDLIKESRRFVTNQSEVY